LAISVIYEFVNRRKTLTIAVHRLAQGVAQLAVLLVVFHVPTAAVVAQSTAGAGYPILAAQIRVSLK